MFTVVGFALVIIAAVWVLYKVAVSYSSAGGTSELVPVYDAAVYPPPMAAVGLYFVLGWLGIDWPIWVFIVIWVGVTLLVIGMIYLAQELGDRVDRWG